MAITFPVGFLFRPTDKEVIKHYLLKKQMGEELPLNGVIQERDVYSEEVLSEIFRSSETHVYFFTQLKKKYLKGSNRDRTVGKATWRSESVDDIRLDENTIIGKKRVLDYINPGSVEHGDWNMKEFSLDGVFLEIPQTSSDYVVCLLEKKEQAIKRDRKKNMQSKKRDRGALENLPSGCFNYKRIKPPSKQNQQTENQQTESAPLVDEQVGLINGEAGVETLEQIMQYLLESDSSMVDVDEENVEQMMQYLLQPDSPLDSMPPLMEAKPAPTVGEDGGYPSGENEIRMQNQQMENQQTESAPLVDERVGLINGEAGVETLEQIMQYLLEPDSSMVDVDEENVEQMMQYLLQPDSPLDSMPPLMEAIPAPTVDEDGGHPSGENESSDYVVCLLEKKERAIKRDRKKNMQSKKYAGGALVNLPSGCDPRMNKRMRFCEEKNQRIEQLLMKSTVEASATSFPAYGLPITVIESAPIAQQVASIHGESAVESMVNVENVVATNTLATLPPSASYDLLECTSMPPLVEDKPAATVDEEGGCTSRKQEIRMLPVEKSHSEYQPSIAAPELLADDAVMDSIILLSTTVEGFAEDFIENFVDQFLNGN